MIDMQRGRRKSRKGIANEGVYIRKKRLFLSFFFSFYTSSLTPCSYKDLSSSVG